jgi:hypothetical protein
MKKIIITIIFIVLMSKIYGQTYNWADSLKSAKHIVSANIGWEYSTIAGLYYGYKLPFKKPIVLQAGISVPFGKKVLDDFKSKVGLQGLVWGKNNFKTILAVNGVYKKYSSELVNLSSLGIELQSEFGIYKHKWFVSGEIGLDLGLTTHFKHSETYKQFIYSEVKDGWYKPVSGAFMNFGIQGGYSFRKSDIVFRIGYIKSITSTANVLIPYYTTIGYNFRIK